MIKREVSKGKYMAEMMAYVKVLRAVINKTVLNLKAKSLKKQDFMNKVNTTDSEASLQNPTLKIIHFYFAFTDSTPLK